MSFALGLRFLSEAHSLALCRFGGMFPDENTPDLLIDGVRFADLPILHVKISKNNTVMSLTNAKGRQEKRRKWKRWGGLCVFGIEVFAEPVGVGSLFVLNVS